MVRVCPVPADRGNIPAMALLQFPELSRGPDADEDEDTIDPTLRDPMENGDEDTGLRFTRGRREWQVQFKYMPREDRDALRNFVETQCLYGSLPFVYTDRSQPSDPEERIVKFAKLPTYKRTAKVQGDDETDGAHRYDITFTLREE